ncbi:MAG: alkaline phosphatase family protein [Thermoplasmata archaeon]
MLPSTRARASLLTASCVLALAVLVLLLPYPTGPFIARAQSVPSPLPQPPKGIQHVVVIMMQDQPASVIVREPYEGSLLSSSAEAASFNATCPPGIGSEIAATSGVIEPAWCSQTGPNGTVPPMSVPGPGDVMATNLADELDQAGLGWTAAMEGMVGNCSNNSNVNFTNSNYTNTSNPFISYSDVWNNATLCDEHDVPFSTWLSAANASEVPVFTWISPDLQDSGQMKAGGQQGFQRADAWLAEHLTTWLTLPWAHSTVFFVTYDDAGSTPHSGGLLNTSGGNVYFVATGPFARAGYVYDGNATDVNLLGTIEWLLGLPFLGQSANLTSFGPMTSLFLAPTVSHPQSNLTLFEEYAALAAVLVVAAAVGLRGARRSHSSHDEVAEGTSSDVGEHPNP